jgi:hypothetical protein
MSAVVFREHPRPGTPPPPDPKPGPIPPPPPFSDYSWGSLTGPGEVGSQVGGSTGTSTSPSSRPSATGSARTGLDAHGLTAVLREALSAGQDSAGARVGRVAVPAASTLPTHRFANERLRGAW